MEQTDGLLYKDMDALSVFKIGDDIWELNHKQFQDTPKCLQITRRIAAVPHLPTNLLDGLSFGFRQDGALRD
jgi:hypothetical protein